MQEKTIDTTLLERSESMGLNNFPIPTPYQFLGQEPAERFIRERARRDLHKSQFTGKGRFLGSFAEIGGILGYNQDNFSGDIDELLYRPVRYGSVIIKNPGEDEEFIGTELPMADPATINTNNYNPVLTWHTHCIPDVDPSDKDISTMSKIADRSPEIIHGVYSPGLNKFGWYSMLPLQYPLRFQ